MKKDEINSILSRLKKHFKVGTDKKLCEILDWRYGTLDTWKNRGKIPIDRLYAISDKFNIDIDYILGKKENLVEEATIPYNATKSNNIIKVPILSVKASAGGGNNIESIDEFETESFLELAPTLFKVAPNTKLMALRVDGESMIPRLLPDSWVIFKECAGFEGDGLYVLNYNNVLMVKLLEVNPQNGNLFIKSINPQYSSWEYDPKEDSSNFKIVGKVLRSIV